LCSCCSVRRIFSICAVLDFNQVVYRCLQGLHHVVHFCLCDFRIIGHDLCTCGLLDDSLCAFLRVCAQVKAVHICDQLFQCTRVRFCSRIQACFTQRLGRFVDLCLCRRVVQGRLR